MAAEYGELLARELTTLPSNHPDKAFLEHINAEFVEYNLRQKRKHLDLSALPYNVDATDPERSVLLEFIIRTDLPEKTVNSLIYYSAQQSVPGIHTRNCLPLGTIRDLYAFDEDELQYLRNIGQSTASLINGRLLEILQKGALPLTNETIIAGSLKRAHEVFNHFRMETVRIWGK